MKQTVYIDILVSINMLTDYFLLRAAGRLAGRISSRGRLCTAAVAGAAESLVILLPPLGFAVRMAFAVLSAAIMTFIGFGFCCREVFLKTFGCLLLTTLCYGGVMSFIWLTLAPRGLTVNNGAVYIDIDPAALVISAMVFYGLSTLISRRLRARTFERSACRLIITRGGERVEISAVLDTGNLLREPFSGLPVIVARRSAIEGVIPDGADGFARGETASPEFRLVPYSALGGGGMLTAFVPDDITVLLDGPKPRSVEACIGFCDDALCPGCEAIVSPDALI